MESNISYTNRVSAMDQECTYYLTNEGLSDGESLWEYSQIREIHLLNTPNRYESELYQCRISSDFGKLTFSNRLYKGLASFQFQNEEYMQFLTVLHQQLKDKGKAQFRSGYKKRRYYTELIAMLVLIPLVLILAYTFNHFTISFIVFIFFSLRLIPYFKKNKPRIYNPNLVPDRLIPTTL